MELEVVNYIKEAQKHGLMDQEIKQNLLDAGWDAATVEKAFSFVKVDETKPSPSEEGHTQDSRMQTGGLARQTLTPQMMPVSATVTTSNPQLNISEQHFGQTNKSSFFKRPVFWAALLVLIGLGVGGYLAYAYVYNNPTKVWNKFLLGKKDTIFENKFNFEYVDHGNTDSSSSTASLFSLKDYKVGVSGDLYVKATDPNNPESKSALQYTFTTGNTSFSTGFQYMLQNKNLYLEIDNNPFLDTILNAAANDGKKYKWIKLDMNAIQEAMNEDPSSADMVKEVFSPSLKNDLAKIWEDASLVKIDKYLGKTQIDGFNTYHFRNTIDKQAVKDVIAKYINRIYAAIKDQDQTVTQQDVDNFNTTVAALVDKIQVKEFETWIGTSDYKLRRVHFVSNAPSFISLMNATDQGDEFLDPLGSAQSKSRDAKRLADVRQMASALELYFNDNDGYPAASNGEPVGLAPMYIGMTPKSPVPADGVCSEWYNTYWYQPMGKKTVVNGKEVYESYEFTFCLGQATGGYAAGNAKLTPSGIQGGQACTGTPEQCSSSGQAQPESSSADKAKAFVDKLDYSAEIRLDVDYTNYGKEQQLQLPTDYFDIMKVLGNAQSKSRDAKRLADVRQLAIAMELYYNDNNSYPRDLNSLVPTYLGIIPQPPTPPDGACSAEDNKYNFKAIDNNNYQITFCLGADAGGYQGGKHTLSPSGIQ